MTTTTTTDGPRYVVLHEKYARKATVLRRHYSEGCYQPYAEMEDCDEAQRLAKHLNERDPR